MERYGKRGWKFDANDALGVRRTYRTNSDGDGLWVLQSNGYEWKQVSGTGQYQLPEDEAAARAQIEQEQEELERI
jgi:hypothetical protein